MDREAVGLLHGVLRAMRRPEPRDRPDATGAKRLPMAVANGIPAHVRLPAADRPAPDPSGTVNLPHALHAPHAPDASDAPR